MLSALTILALQIFFSTFLFSGMNWDALTHGDQQQPSWEQETRSSAGKYGVTLDFSETISLCVT